MKTKAIFIVLVVLGVFLAVACLIGASLLRQENENLVKSNLVFLQMCINRYAADAQKAGKAQTYPQTLETLVSENYLAHDDLRELKVGSIIQYFAPTRADTSSVIILRAKVGNTLLSCPLKGPVQ